MYDWKWRQGVCVCVLLLLLYQNHWAVNVWVEILQKYQNKLPVKANTRLYYTVWYLRMYITNGRKTLAEKNWAMKVGVKTATLAPSPRREKRFKEREGV